MNHEPPLASLLSARFDPLERDEARAVEGGFAVNPVTVGGAVALGSALVLGAFGAGVAIGYWVNKTDCPDDADGGTGDGADTSDTGTRG